MPKVSIITPIFCDTSIKVDWLEETIQSVISQTLVDWEIILIDDKSPLSLDPVRMKYAGDTRLRWFENAENDGPAKTRNTAVALAESECILPLDSDDLLANEEALEFMYDAWLMDQTKTIYGNVQLYTALTPTVFQRGKIIQLAQYNFDNVMNLNLGVMSVSAMHSKEAHYKAGGWKAELDQGREDVEYWIATGKAGFCGQKIKATTLLYRRHVDSRDYQLKFVNKKLEDVQRQIKAMHTDIYNGRFPVACCGKQAASASVAANNPDPVALSEQAQRIKKITELDGYEENDLEWVLYNGPRQGSIGRTLVPNYGGTAPPSYHVLGKGHIFQIDKRHRKYFEDRQRLGFEMNQPDPRQQSEPEPEPVTQLAASPQIIEMPKPQMSTIVRMDSIASQTREAEIQEVIEHAVAEANYKTIEQEYTNEASVDDFVDENTPLDFDEPELSELKLSTRLTETLEENNFTVSSLAYTTPQKLSSLPGIGIRRANSIIQKAQELINST